MIGKKKVVPLGDCFNGDLVRALEEWVEQHCPSDAPQREAILAIIRKDLCLVEAAIAADRTVISSEKKVWKHLDDAAVLIGVLGTVGVLNPIAQEDSLVGWLESGAIVQAEHMLGPTRTSNA